MTTQDIPFTNDANLVASTAQWYNHNHALIPSYANTKIYTITNIQPQLKKKWTKTEKAAKKLREKTTPKTKKQFPTTPLHTRTPKTTQICVGIRYEIQKKTHQNRITQILVATC